MKIIIQVFLIALTFNSLFANELVGSRANFVIPGASKIYTTSEKEFPLYIQFQKGKEIAKEKFNNWIKTFLLEPENASFKLKAIIPDKIGMVHYRYQQYYKNIPIDKGVFVLHIKDDLIVSISGNIYVNVSLSNSGSISKEQVIQIAKNKMNAFSYKWEIASEEQQLKNEQKDNSATYYPAPKLVILKQNNKYLQAYDLVLYSHKPLDKKEFIINSVTGDILDIRQRLYEADVNGTAVTKYSGNQTITTDSYAGSYRLRETGRGNGIETYNVNTGTNYGSATDFTDTDNYWNNVNAQVDEAATDAHWAAEMTYDYYLCRHGFNSIDNAGFRLLSYVHYDQNYSNAFWDGQRMTYGDGNSNPFTTVDIAGHEITHGLTEFNAGLIYQDESGALNEGYSDIFATAIEFYAKPTVANWTMAEDLGSPFRSLQNPNAYGDPDTYHGTNWYSGTADYGGVHTNSQVIGHWYYLLCQGGSGQNDIGNTYSVSGIGMDNASQVAFRTLTLYLAADATYEDARFFSILSAIDLFGPCTPEVEAVTNAMYAIGLGVPYVPNVVADFASELTSACSAPFTVNFQNISNNSTSFVWNFGDGNTSTAVSPSHTYNSLGTFNVSLIADGGTCGSDTMLKTSFISIDNANPCIIVMPTSGSGITQNSCTGTLYDGGGPTGNYIDNADAIITISPIGATNVTIDFMLFDIEPGTGSICDYDYLEIFDGPNTSSVSLGRFCNTTGNPGTIVSTGGSLTLMLHSDQGLNLAGFEANWSCSLANTPPVADFSISNETTCTGEILFSDLSTNGPTSWFWDFGDGSNSTLQNPAHNYLANGVYNVTLVSINSFGSDTIIYPNLVSVNRPQSPITLNDTICVNEQALLIANGNGTLNWFSSLSGGNSLYTGNSFITPVLSSTTTYFVENTVISSIQNVGDLRSASAGSFFNNNVQHYLVFDCMSPCVLVSVEVNANTGGTRLIQLKNSSGTILDAVSVNIPAGVSRVNLNFDIPIGSDFQLTGPINPDLWRNNTNCSYPYLLSGIISIKSSSASTNPTGYYYYFYDWEVKEPDCVSPRVSVTALVENCQSVHEILNSEIEIYPNPIDDKVYIAKPASTEIYSICISDALGKLSITKKVNDSENSIELDLCKFASGIYFIALETNMGNLTHKIVKK